jgi:hypothetical protein
LSERFSDPPAPVHKEPAKSAETLQLFPTRDGTVLPLPSEPPKRGQRDLIGKLETRVATEYREIRRIFVRLLLVARIYQRHKAIFLLPAYFIREGWWPS